MGGEELKWRQLTHNQLMSPPGPHFSPHSTAKTNNDKNTNLGMNDIYWYKFCCDRFSILREIPSEEVDDDDYEYCRTQNVRATQT